MNEVFVSAGESPIDPVKGVPIRDFVVLLASAMVGHLHFLFSKEGMLELSRSIMFDNLWIYIVAISAPSINQIIVKLNSHTFGSTAVEVVTNLDTATREWVSFRQKLADTWLSYTDPVTKKWLEAQPHWAKQWTFLTLPNPVGRQNSGWRIFCRSPNLKIWFCATSRY
jgi:hypothetical protein